MLLAKLRIYLEMIRFSHTVFALPFALMGAVLAARGIPPADTLLWILVAMVGARSGAMGVNRIADRHLDAQNPRTQGRALPQGRIAPAEAWVFVVASFGVFLWAAWRLNPLCLTLAPVAILIVAGYSYTKRFTALSHCILGLSLALAPIGAWIAVTGRLALAPLVLGVAVLFWVAGFDVLYALLDIQFDRSTGLFSIPARLGEQGGLLVARLFHGLTLVGLAVLIPMLRLGSIYTAGLLLASALLVYQHVLLHRHGLAKVEVACFNVNAVLSVGMFLSALGDLLFSK
ncbi:MAG TPA: UbiA-like polyprenyltransferase [Candidatus Methylomirabilis sp.]|nr:UbiA-like polyprenyltransferase [Candidatus Methylomirabilis sp.]